MKLKAIVRIANPEEGAKRYTSGKRAMEYISSGRAVLTDDGQLFFSERHVAQTRHAYDPVTGKFAWFVGDSGGSSLMKAYEGISGGHRVFQAVHADEN